MLTESRRKWLTEYIGEKFHPGLVGLPYTFGGYRYSNRLFESWDDLGAVKEAIEKAGRWSQFEDFTFWEWQKIPLTEMTTHMQWLIDPARFCDLAGEWLKQKG